MYSPTRPRKPFLLAADIDGTLLGNEEGQAALKILARDFHEAFRLAYITGRYEWSVLKLVEEGSLPRPDFICSNVGTELTDLNDPQNSIGRKYAALADLRHRRSSGGGIESAPGAAHGDRIAERRG